MCHYSRREVRKSEVDAVPVTEEGKANRAAAGAANLATWKAKNPAGGGLTHGATSRHFRRRYSDLRTAEGKGLQAALDALVEDLGGDLRAGQLLVLPRVREKLITLALIGSWIDKQSDLLTKTGDLLPVLKSSYLGYSESLRRDVEWLYSMASRRPSRTVDLESYIAGKKAAKQNGSGE